MCPMAARGEGKEIRYYYPVSFRDFQDIEALNSDALSGQVCLNPSP
jgi:hypothetical protein